MISFALWCENRHRFDAWFRTAAAFDEQVARGIVTCPGCGSPKVEKAPMARAIQRATAAPSHPDQQERGPPAALVEALSALRAKVVAEADYVGDQFAEEARKIHYREAEERGIYGEATREDVAALAEEGIDVLPLPRLPGEAN